MLREVRLPPVPGRLLLTAMPGRDGPLEDELAEIARCSRVVVLTTDEEIAAKSPLYGEWLAARPVDASPPFVRYPIGDFRVPDDPDAFLGLAREIASRVQAGESVVVHCAAGIGRTGMFATCVLIALGVGRDDALAAVDRAGSGPETPEQRELIAGAARRPRAP